MLFNEIDFPNTILDALQKKSLVVFAGAGVSMGPPTSLPNFKKLTEMISEDTGNDLDTKKDSCEAFLGSLKAEGINVNKLAADLLATCKEHNQLHEAIIDLFKSSDEIKIVTTNYDQMFEHVVESRNEKVPVYNVPALPLGNDIEGIIHIHGNVNKPNYMVLTDEDFGRAYLTEGYASKFLVQLFETYTILFVGYSYNDIIMKYLTRAISISTSNKRYILTDNKEFNWSILGLTPIYYKKNSHAVMREGLFKLGKASKKGLLEWRTQFEGNKDIPPEDLTSDSEIDYCLEDCDKSTVLARTVRGQKWLEYLDKKDVFAECFSDEKEMTRKGELWSAWICSTFIGEDDNSLLLLIAKHRNIISKPFADHLARRLLNAPNIKIDYLMKYLLVICNRLSHRWITHFIDKLTKEGQYHAAFVLLKKMFEFTMQLKRNNWMQPDSVEFNHAFISDHYLAERSWNQIKEKATAEFPYEVISFVIEKITELHLKYEMAGQASKTEEPWEFAMLSIEEGEEYYKDNPLLVLSNMMIDASCTLHKEHSDLLRTTLLQGINSVSLLLKKIILKVIREVKVFSPDEQLAILLDNDLLGSFSCHEQVFLLAASMFANLNEQAKNSLFSAIEKLKKEDPSNPHYLYSVYNWYVWLQKVEPDNIKIQNRIKQLQEENNYAPREHPELNMWSSPVKWIKDESPLSEEEMIKLPMSQLFDKLKNYNEDPFEGPSRKGLLNTFSIVLSKDHDWTSKIAKCLIDSKINTDDIWQSVFYGLQNATYDLDEVFALFKFIIQNIEDVGCIYGAAECLWEILKRKDSKAFFLAHEQDFFNASVDIWNHREHVYDNDTRVIYSTLNTTTGLVLLSWIHMVSFIDKNAIPEKYKQCFDEAINLQSLEKNVAVCILAGHFNFFCYKDLEWSKNILMPFFSCDDKDLYSSAWEGMVYFSNKINKDTSDIIAPIYYRAIKNIKWLEDETKSAFIDILLILMIYVVERPTYKYIPEFYRNTSIKDHQLFIQKIEYRLNSMDDAQKINWWNTWLKRFLENRKENKPIQLEANENCAILNLLTALPEVFDDMVKIVCKGKTPDNIDDLFWSNLNDMDIAAKKPHSMAKLLINLLTNVTSLSMGREFIQSIIDSIGPLDDKEKQSLQEVLIKWSIDML